MNPPAVQVIPLIQARQLSRPAVPANLLHNAQLLYRSRRSPAIEARNANDAMPKLDGMYTPIGSADPLKL